MAYSGLVIAIDQSKSCTGVGEARPGEVPRFYSFTLGRPDDDEFEADARAIGWMAERLLLEPDMRDVRVVLEAPLERLSGGNSSAGTILQAYGICKAIGGFARARGCKVITGNVRTVRSAFLGKGNGNLPGEKAKRMARDVCRAIGWDPPNLDCADAGALLWWACEQWAPGVMPPVHPLMLAAAAKRRAA